MPLSETVVAELAAAVLDGRPIDWAATESNADAADCVLIDQLRVLAALADLHRPPGSDAPSAGTSGDLRAAENSAANADVEGRTFELHGSTIGPYRLGALLGRGGMGEVYLADRVDGRFEQQVAVKLVKRGMDSGEILRRFARERRILARLDHPGIARLFDAGETPDGRPYFVMERVEGERITDYCRARGLPLDERLQLLAACCDAVDAAHRGLIVHRDLKPSNILVTSDGLVKLLDFGVAKLLGDDEDETQVTRLGGRMLTAAYAAPEQILGGEITVATDVFALGVVLYELLTDGLPYDRRATTPYALAARVEHESTERPSTTAARALFSGGSDTKRRRWIRRLRGDLDAIATTALAHEPDRRYPSAAAFAADVRRYLTSKPIEARPDTAGYRLRKFVRRHRLGVTATAVAAVAIVVALAVSLYETAAARREARRAAAAQAFLTSLFEQSDPDRYVASAPTVRDLVEGGAKRVDVELRDQPELRADMEAVLGQVFDQLSLPRQGEAQFRRAVETRQALYGAGDPRTVKARKGLAISLARLNRFGEAEALFQQVVEQNEALGDRHELGSVLLNYGNLERIKGDYGASAGLLERAVALLESAPGSASRSLAAALNNLGLVYWRQGRLQDAVKDLERALAIHLKNGGPSSTPVARVKLNLSILYRALNQLEAAERYAEEALAIQQILLPPGHSLIGTTLTSLGEIAQKRGDRAKARTLFERSISHFEASPPDDPGLLPCSLRDLGALSYEEGKTMEALQLYERALAMRRQTFGDRNRNVAESWQDVARVRLALGDFSGATEAARKGVDSLRSAASEEGPPLASGLLLLGDTLQRSHHPREALAPLEQADAIWRKQPPTDPRDVSRLQAALAATRAALR